MPTFGIQSAAQLATCHPDLQRVMRAVVEQVDIKVLEGHRGKAAQDAAFAAGNSKLRWPNGNHNATPSNAVDVAPYPVQWPGPSRTPAENLAMTVRFYYVAGIVLATAHAMGIALRWGGDWDGDDDFRDQTFDDLVHFERIR